MKTFASLVKKEFTHILRDVRTMLIVLLLPVVLILFLRVLNKLQEKRSKIAKV